MSFVASSDICATSASTSQNALSLSISLCISQVLMPSKSVSALIGVRGVNVKELQKTTGCHIHVDGVALGFGAGGDRPVYWGDHQT